MRAGGGGVEEAKFLLSETQACHAFSLRGHWWTCPE